MDEQTFLHRVFLPRMAVICLYLISLTLFGWLTRSERCALDPPLRLFTRGETLRLLKFVFGYSATKTGNHLAAIVAWGIRALFLASAVFVAMEFSYFFSTFFRHPPSHPL